MKRLRVGVLELLVPYASRGVLERGARMLLAKQSASVMPQAIAAWARRAGHAVRYAAWYGQEPPERLLPPREIDVLLLACHSRASLVAYALAALYRRERVVTVIGGPHASAFPRDAGRHFDTVVDQCDEPLLRDVLADPRAHRGFVTTTRPLAEIPGVEERLPEIRTSAFLGSRPFFATTIPMLASAGCPYTCDFCIDAAKDYTLFPLDGLRHDLAFLERRYPGVRLVFHDPNFAVRFDRVLSVLEERPETARHPYAMQATLSVLTRQRLPRLAATRCVYVAPSLESFNDYGAKAGVGRATGRAKLTQVIDHLLAIHEHVPGVQVNVIFGLDQDGDGALHLALFEDLVRALPFALITATIAMPYGGTVLHERLKREGRLLTALPPAFYYVPHLASLPRDGDARGLVDRLHRAFSIMTEGETLRARWRSRLPRPLALLHNIRALEARRTRDVLAAMRSRLQDDPQMRAFHAGRTLDLPDYYKRLARTWLGRHAELVPDDALVPEHGSAAPDLPHARVRAI